MTGRPRRSTLLPYPAFFGAAVVTLAEPPVPQLTALRSDGGEPPVSLTVYVPGTTTKAVVAVPALMLRVNVAGRPPAPSKGVAGKLPFAPVTCFDTFLVPLNW